MLFLPLDEVCGTQEISISPDDINTCEACFSNVAVLFVTLNDTGGEKLRKKLKLNVSVDPTFDPSGPGKYVCCRCSLHPCDLLRHHLEKQQPSDVL